MRCLLVSRFLGPVLTSLACCICASAQTQESKPSILSGVQLYTYQAPKEDERAKQAPPPAANANDPAIMLAPLYLNERPLRIPKDALLTQKGREELAKKRYLNPLYRKTFGPLSAIAGLLANPLGGWNPNTPEAMALYEQDEQIRRNTEMKDLIGLDNIPAKAKAP